MTSIATLTLNPTIDIAYEVDALTHTDKLRTPPQICDPGGGGINVARVFVRLGGNARCVYLSGGPTGVALDSLLDLHQIVREKVGIGGDTRVSTTVLERESGLEYRLVPSGPEVGETEWQACLTRLEEVDCKYLVMSGSLPLGVPSDFYARAVRIARRRGIAAVLDTSGDPLHEALEEGGLELVKPNLKEFRTLVGSDLSDDSEIAEKAAEIVTGGGARLVAVTMGERGGILASGQGTLQVDAPQVDTASAVGAGDSCVAGMLFGLASGKSDPDAFRLGIAAGAAALITPGTCLALAKDIERLARQMGVEA